jgi:hypothetical protein
MILEGVVTTLDPDGRLHIAPMGPEVGETMDRFILRPFRTARTFSNLKAHPEGVLHVTDDVLLLAQAAIGPVEPAPPSFPAACIRGYVLEDCCRYYEFRVSSVDDRQERTRLEAEVVQAGRRRNFFGFNRAKHAVVEAAILATRTAFLPLEEIEAEYRKLAIIVQKTGGEQERRAMTILEQYLASEKAKRQDPSRS